MYRSHYHYYCRTYVETRCCEYVLAITYFSFLKGVTLDIGIVYKTQLGPWICVDISTENNAYLKIVNYLFRRYFVDTF
jgi:hypothetical protein